VRAQSGDDVVGGRTAAGFQDDSGLSKGQFESVQERVHRVRAFLLQNGPDKHEATGDGRDEAKGAERTP
jgi:hypothetical protein